MTVAAIKRPSDPKNVAFSSSRAIRYLSDTASVLHLLFSCLAPREPPADIEAAQASADDEDDAEDEDDAGLFGGPVALGQEAAGVPQRERLDVDGGHVGWIEDGRTERGVPRGAG